MGKLYFLMLLISLPVTAQPLTFDKSYVDAIDQWVVFPERDGSHFFGFIYVDSSAGLTLNSEGTLKIENNTLSVIDRTPATQRAVARLSPGKQRVAVLSKSELKKLGLPEHPSWLSTYKKTATAASDKYWRGFLYNASGESTKAIPILTDAFKQFPDYPRMAFELAFAHNATGNFNEAIAVCKAGLKKDKEDCLLYKELSYSQMGIGKIEDAEKTYLECAKNCSTSTTLSEISHNLAYQYFGKGNKEKFAQWANELRTKYPDATRYVQNVGIMEARLKSQ